MRYFRGKLVEVDEALVSADDHGLLYGAGGFETFRTYGGKTFLLDRHLDRLRETLSPLCIQNSDTLLLSNPDSLQAAMASLADAHGGGDFVYRYSVSAGPAGHHLPHGPYIQPWDMLACRSLPTAASTTDRTLRLLSLRRDSGELRPRGKTLAYLNSLLGWRELEQEAADEGLMLTKDGTLCECVTSNLFFSRKGRLFTPAIETGLLPGVHRNYLIELAQARKLPFEQGQWPFAHLIVADAIFTVNAVTGPRPVSRVLDHKGQEVWQKKAVACPVVSVLTEHYKASLPHA
ncbi:MAG: aminotransferase class IV [Verrucomicrobiota bacterium]